MSSSKPALNPGAGPVLDKASNLDGSTTTAPAAQTVPERPEKQKLRCDLKDDAETVLSLEKRSPQNREPPKQKRGN